MTVISLLGTFPSFRSFAFFYSLSHPQNNATTGQYPRGGLPQKNTYMLT